MVKQRKSIHTINTIKNGSENYWISLNKDQVYILIINIKFEEKSLYPHYRKRNKSYYIVEMCIDIILSC